MDDIVAEMVRGKLDAGVLPVERPVKLWAGDGSGQACAVCEQPILQTQPEYEAEYYERPAIRFHHRCHKLWQEELRRRGY